MGQEGELQLHVAFSKLANYLKILNYCFLLLDIYITSGFS